MTPPDDELAPQPLERAFALPAHCYAGTESLARDRRAVFARGWQCLARADQLAHPGDHVVAEVAGVPLLLVRGDDGVLRALHNVCRHRAGPLATCDGRGAKRLRCHYHGWSYALDGRLLSATEMDEACGFDAASVRLPEAHRDVIVLRHYAEMSYDEIAVALGIPEKTVKSRLFSARQRLCEMLSTARA